jgi:hypothetical protein
VLNILLRDLITQVSVQIIQIKILPISLKR